MLFCALFVCSCSTQQPALPKSIVDWNVLFPLANRAYLRVALVGLIKQLALSLSLRWANTRCYRRCRLCISEQNPWKCSWCVCACHSDSNENNSLFLYVWYTNRTRKTKYKWKENESEIFSSVCSCCCVVFQSIIQDQERRIDRKNLCAYHTHTRTRGRALIRVRVKRRRRRDGVVNNARIDTNRRVLQNKNLFSAVHKHTKTNRQKEEKEREREERRRPSLSVVYRL